MICPGCSSVIPQIDSELIVKVEDAKQYEHKCDRCETIIRVTVLVVKYGPEELRKKWKDWLNKDVIEASNQMKNEVEKNKK